MRLVLAVLLPLSLLLLVFPASASAQMHEDSNYGYKIRPPRDWNPSSKRGTSHWVIGKFISKRASYQNDKDGWTWDYNPEMTVIAFVHKVIKSEQIEKKEEVKDDGSKSVVIAINTPYKDYKDYLKRTYSGGGFYFSKEESTKHKDIPVDVYEVKVEKNTWGGPRRLITWVYHLNEVDIAVQFEILENSYAKLRKDISTSFKSLRTVERTGEFPTVEATPLTEAFSRTEWNELLPEERADLRKDLEKKAHEKALKELPKGWRHFKVGDILVLDNWDQKKAKKLAQQCQAIRKWLDETLYFVGPGEYVRAPILKVHRREASSTGFTISFGGFLDDIEIEYAHDPNWVGVFDWDYEQVNRRVLELWFNDRDRDLYWAMPYWMDYGLTDMIENSRAKGTRLEFPKDAWDSTRLRAALSKDQLSTPRELLMMGRDEFFSGRYKRDEASAMVRFLKAGAGSRSKKTKHIFSQYLNNLQLVKAEIKREEDEAKEEEDTTPKTEEEEDAYFKEQQTAWKDKEKRVLEAVFNRTFKGWTEKDWKSFETAYFRSIDD